MRTERAKYFEALETHPRLMVGQEVPTLDGTDTMEVLRSTEDAREWQEAVKSILVEEVRSKANAAMEENSDFLSTLHASIELFQKNPDLIPATRGFDQDLANRFAALAEPYELRVDNKLQGYSIQVQPLVDHLRAQLAAERSAAPVVVSPTTEAAAPAGAAASTPAAPAPPAPAAAPQAGIPSKAGSGAEQEDFSVLFGTIGLPNLRI